MICCVFIIKVEFYFCIVPSYNKLTFINTVISSMTVSGYSTIDAFLSSAFTLLYGITTSGIPAAYGAISYWL